MDSATSLTRTQSLARALLLFACGLALLFGASAAFADGTSHDDAVLVATFGPGMGIFGIALTLIAFDTGDRRAWLALWWLPVFFAIHVAAIGTWIPDGPLAILCAAGLVLGRPGERRSASPVHAPA